MLKLFFLLTILSLISSCSTTRNTNTSEAEVNCQTKWNYIKLIDTIQGTVILHRKAMAACGRVPFASLTLIQTANMDTIRILELCSFKEFKITDKVKVLPGYIPLSDDFVVPTYRTTDFKYINDAFECSVLKTYWGNIRLVN